MRNRQCCSANFIVVRWILYRNPEGGKSQPPLVLVRGSEGRGNDTESINSQHLSKQI